MGISHKFLTKSVLRDFCNECRSSDWRQCCQLGARLHLPRFPPIPSNCVQQTPVHQHLLSTFTVAKFFKMAQSFSNNHNSFNVANIFNTTASGDRSEILGWLSPLEPRVRHRDIGARRVDSIGAWLLETEEYKRWRNGSSEDGSYQQTLFCDGNPGAGRSYIVYEAM